MLPALRRFYGGSLEEWLAMPMLMFNIHVEEMPKIQARESLLGSTVAAMGAGMMRKSDMDAVRRGWIREAQDKNASHRRMSKEQFKEHLAKSGIPISMGKKNG